VATHGKIVVAHTPNTPPRYVLDETSQSRHICSFSFQNSNEGSSQHVKSALILLEDNWHAPKI
jgi:hypothetical protein